MNQREANAAGAADTVRIRQIRPAYWAPDTLHDRNVLRLPNVPKFWWPSYDDALMMLSDTLLWLEGVTPANRIAL